MKAKPSVRRRDFLRTAGAAGVAGWLSGLGALNGCGRPTSAQSAKPQALEKIMAQLDALSGQYLTIPKQEGQFLNLLVKATRARRVLEVGTAFGYTTLWLALALKETGGKLTTIEILPERVELARKHVGEAGFSSRVAFHQGDAHEIVPTLAGPFDFVYLDADKGRQEDYFNKLIPNKFSRGGLFIAHSAILLADKMETYLNLVRHHPELDTVIVSATMDDGFALSYRKRTTA